MTIKLYDLVQKEDGGVSVQTDLSPEDMLALLTIGFYACLERGVMVKSLAGHFPPQEEAQDPAVTEDYNEYLDIVDVSEKTDAKS